MNRRDMIAGIGLAMAAAGSAEAAPTVPQPSVPKKRALVEGATILVTGSNQGIGRGYVEVLLARGAKRVYATARRPETLREIVALDPKRVVPLELDINIDSQRRAVAEKAQDVTWLINNAAIPGSRTDSERHFLQAASLNDAKQVMETNCWSQAELARLFIPIIRKNGGGALVQMLSIGALFCLPEYASYCASKAAASVMAMGLRIETDADPIMVARVYTGGVKTRTAPDATVTPVQHANEVFDALAAGQVDIWPAGAAAMRDHIYKDPIAFEHELVDRYHTNPISIEGG